ncbi:MAG: adenosylcobinamide-phosphate synthase CbiB [Cyanobacteriota bacterium]|nr:adenosylcobinamide-phosphate synthase CbiB [Cyanobacteriota bacterium]
MLMFAVEWDAAIALLLAAFLDYLIGDPWGWPHPVRVMGWAIAHYTNFVKHHLPDKRQRRIAGIFLGLGLIGSSAFVGWFLVESATWIHPLFGTLIAAIMLASCFAGRSLRAATEDVLVPLRQGDLATARTKLSYYVGRDTHNLSESEILRALLETIAENTTDGATAPLFYAIVGALIPGVGSVPFALAYKAASTLDSMVGYRTKPLAELGWFSAQLEDRLTWLPCRLTVLAIALFSGKPRRVWQLCCRDAPQDPSPNSGWSECAYAAALGVQLGGTNTYNGIVKEKPRLGESDRAISLEEITRSLFLMRACLLLGLLFFLACWLSMAILAPSEG